MPRTAKVGLAIAVAGLTAFLGLSSVAWSSTTQVSVQAAAPKLSDRQIRRAVEGDAGKLRAAFCAGPNRRHLPCAGKPSSSPKPSAGGRKAPRIAHFDLSDPVCPVWWIDKPHAGYATVGTNAAAACVTQISGHDIAKAPFSFSQDPEIGVLNLWNYTGGHWVKEGHVSSDFGNCTVFAVNISIWPFNVEHVKVCAASGLVVHAPVFPPAGTYKGELTVITLSPQWTGPTMIDVSGEHFCYFC
jgi:hypothetical protein